MYKPRHRFGIVLFILSLVILFAIGPLAFLYAILKPVYQVISRFLYFLAYSGVLLCNLLNCIDKDHVEKAREEEILERNL